MNSLGLIPVRQTLTSHQPVDELKKGPFTLQGRVLEYRRVGRGVEVDVCLSAAARSQSPVWESVVTLLSENQRHRAVSSSAERANETAGGDGGTVTSAGDPHGCVTTPTCPSPNPVKELVLRLVS